MTKSEVKKTNKLESLRIHVERAINQIKLQDFKRNDTQSQWYNMQMT